MKLIITEKQYKSIKNHILEAKVKYSNEVMEKLGEKVLHILDFVGQNKTTQFEMESGNNFVLKCTNDDNYVFTFEIVEDTAKILKNWNTLSIKLNPGNGENDGTAYEYSINKNVISTNDNGNTFNLTFHATKKTGPTSDLKIVKIKGVKNYTQTVTPEKQPEKQPEKNDDEKNDDEKNDDEKMIEKGKKAYDYIINDPYLKQAFYKKPSFLNLFMAELKGKKAPGTGILPTLQILDKYETNKATINDGFKKGKIALFISYNKDYQISSDFKITKDEKNAKKAIVEQYDYETKTWKLKIGKNKGYIITAKKTNIENVFECEINGFVKKGDIDVEQEPNFEKINLKFINSEGYQTPIKKYNKKPNK